MKRFFGFHLLTGLLAVAFTMSAVAQQGFILDQGDSKLTVLGTSSIHDWEMDAEMFNGETGFFVEGDVITGISFVDFSCDVSELTSGKRIMDNKAHDALEEKAHPFIRFSLVPDAPVRLEEHKVRFSGNLNVAGKTRKVPVEASVKKEGSDSFAVSGQVPVKMSDFGIEPPTAMLGTLKTGDEVVVKFDLTFRKSTEELTSRQ